MRSRLAGVVIIVKICPSFGSSIRQFKALCYSSSLYSGPRRSIIENTVQERISYADVSVKVGYYGVCGVPFDEYGESPPLERTF